MQEVAVARLAGECMGCRSLMEQKSTDFDVVINGRIKGMVHGRDPLTINILRKTGKPCVERLLKRFPDAKLGMPKQFAPTAKAAK